MKYLFKGIPFRVVFIPLICILWSAIITGVYLFFSNVLAGYELQFVYIWKYIYIGLVIFEFTTDVVLTILYRAVFGHYYSKKLNATFSDVLEAYLVHDLLSRSARENLTPDAFVENLKDARFKAAAMAIAKEVVKNINSR